MFESRFTGFQDLQDKKKRFFNKILFYIIFLRYSLLKILIQTIKNERKK
jgi:hypothetical protein